MNGQIEPEKAKESSFCYKSPPKRPFYKIITLVGQRGNELSRPKNLSTEALAVCKRF